MIIAKDARESAFGVALEKLLKIYPDPQENEVNVGNFSQARESTNLTFQRDRTFHRGKIPSYMYHLFKILHEFVRRETTRRYKNQTLVNRFVDFTTQFFACFRHHNKFRFCKHLSDGFSASVSGHPCDKCSNVV
jgi:hypothetical protein